MSFSAGLKNEILESRFTRGRFEKALAYGLFLFSKSFSKDAVKAAGENSAVIKLYSSLVKKYLGNDVKILTGEKAQNGKTVCTCEIADLSDRLKLLRLFDESGGANRINIDLLPGHEHVCAFLSGAYLACGNITDPQKSYHIEFVVRSESLRSELLPLLDSCVAGVKKAGRRGGFLAYYKEYSQIEDLLTLMGATKSCLKMIDIEMMKLVRNNANRATNCETANIDKLVDAARSRTRDIALVLDTAGEDALPKDLREIADLRLLNPDMSLSELGALLSPKLSRSGVHHRLKRISKLAENIRLGKD